MSVIKFFLGFIIGSLIAVVVIGCGVTLVGGSIQLPAYSVLVVVGGSVSAVATRLVPLGYFVSVLVGMLLFIVIAWVVIAVCWPETNYEKALGYIFVCGSAGALTGGVARKSRALWGA